MRAWLMERQERIEKLRLDEVADPAPGPGQALLRVKFAALNPADMLLAGADYPTKPPLPHVLGRDGVGEVLAMGAGVENVRAGEMAGILRCAVGVSIWGTFAEKVVVPAERLIAVPQGWSLEETAAAPLVFLTAWQALNQWTETPPLKDSILLVTGASGGVGIASVLLGKSMELVVVALSRSPEKRAQLRELGADFVFDPADEELSKTVLAALAPKKVDLAVDNVGGKSFRELLAMLGYGGRISIVGRSGGVVPEFDTLSLFFNRNRIGGVSVGDYSSDAAQAAWKQIVGRLNAMSKRPVVDSVFAFEDLKLAFAHLAQGPMGKILLRMRG